MEAEQGTSTPPKEQMPQDSKAAAAEKKGSPVTVSPATTTTNNAALVYVRRKVEIDTSKVTQPKDVLLVSSSTPPPPPAPDRLLDWEERYHQLQMHLNKLNESDHQHLHMLWSQSSAELSKHAVDLEKRSIQLSLEEAREMQRVAALNVLGRSVNSLKSTSQ